MNAIEIAAGIIGGEGHGKYAITAKALGMSDRFFYQLRTGRRPVPTHVAVKVRDLTSGVVSVADLRPDLADAISR